jgi:SAM-dependent methyltransferase
MSQRLRCRAERVWLNAVRQVFGFDAWHASAPYTCRPYKKRVVELANTLHPHTVVEVGCGLGDIVSRIDAQCRYGLDLDPRVIRAARFLHAAGVEWVAGTSAALDELLASLTFIDCLIMVNWIHNVSPEDLAAQLEPLLPKTRYLILDSVDQDAPASYRVRHDFAFLDGKAVQLAAARVPGEPRRFLLFKTPL